MVSVPPPPLDAGAAGLLEAAETVAAVVATACVTAAVGGGW